MAGGVVVKDKGVIIHSQLFKGIVQLIAKKFDPQLTLIL